MMFLSHKPIKTISSSILLGLALFAMPTLAHAQVPSLTGSYSFSGGLYSYSFSVFNPLTISLADANIALPLGMTIQNLGAPAGFQTTYDSVLNLVDFTPLAGSGFDFDPGSTVSGFTFVSPTSLPSAEYNILASDATSYSGTVTLSGPVSAPEPSSVALLLASALPVGMALVVRRRRGARRVSVS